MRPLSSVLCEVAQTKNRDRVLWIVLDNASVPRLGGLSTDDVHVAMKYDSPMGGHRSAGSCLLHRMIQKFEIPTTDGNSIRLSWMGRDGGDISERERESSGLLADVLQCLSDARGPKEVFRA